jgi:hypothetical protein
MYWKLDKRDILGAVFIHSDSDFVRYFSPYTGFESQPYNLQSGIGGQDTIDWPGLVWSRLVDVKTRVVFGIETTVRTYRFDGLAQYEVYLADGFGIIRAYDFGDPPMIPFSKYWELRGAIIHGTQYGQTDRVAHDDALPSQIRLHQNYPNPFNPSTTIEFELPNTSEVRLSVENILGQEVRLLASGQMSAGRHRFTFDATCIATGVYIYSLETPAQNIKKKLLVLR